MLERSYVDAAVAYPEAGVYAEAFQANLDYAYSNYLYNHMLPTNLLVGWNMERSKNNVEGCSRSHSRQNMLLLQNIN